METVTRKLKGIKKEFIIYTKAEADKEGIPYKYWKDSNATEWALTDDDYVMQVIKRSTYGDANRKRDWVSMAGGSAWTSSDLKFEERKAHGSFSYSTSTLWDAKVARTTRLRDMVRAYASDIVNHKHVDYEVLGRMFQPSAQKPALTVKKLLKGEKVREMIDAEVARLLEDKGITKSLALDVLMEAIEAARTTARPSDLLRVAQELQELTGIKKDKNLIKTTETIEATSSTLDLIDKESEKIAKVKLQRAVERADNES